MIRLELQTTVKFRSSDYDRVLRLLRSEDEQPTLLLFVGADADALRAAANEVAKAALLERLAKYCGVSIVIAQSSEDARARWRARLIIVT